MAASDDNFDQFDDELPEGSEVQGGDRRKRLFSKELRCMMYGFGDDQNPYTESVDLLEDLVIEFIIEMTHKAMEIGRTGRVQVEDIVFLVRKDPRKYARVKDLLTMNEELKKARKAFDEVKVSSVLNRDAKGFGKQHLTDKNEDTCWNSDQGSPQWVHVEFPSPVLPSELQLQFQGGFAGKEMHLEVKTPGQPDATASAGDFYPEDSNLLQMFPLKMDAPISNLRVVFRSSTDMFGRIVLYKLDVIG